MLKAGAHANGGPSRVGPAVAAERAGLQHHEDGARAHERSESVGWQNFGKVLLVSAVSAPIFARKYAFCSIFQNLPDYQAEFFEIWQYFANFATFAKMC